MKHYSKYVGKQHIKGQLNEGKSSSEGPRARDKGEPNVSLLTILHKKSWNFLSFTRCVWGWYFGSDLSGYLCLPRACYSHILFGVFYVRQVSLFQEQWFPEPSLCLMLLCRLCPRSWIILLSYLYSSTPLHFYYKIMLVFLNSQYFLIEVLVTTNTL